MPAMIGGFGKIKHFFIMKNDFSSKSNEVIYITPSTDINNITDNTTQNSKPSIKLGPYLAGLIEADGSIAVH
jgi:hypothetical protein